MKPDLTSDYAFLRNRLQTLMAEPVKNFLEIDQIIDELEKIQLAIKVQHGIMGNNPNE
ncbi:MAG: hypothetical protein HHJ19_00060 [Polaromonas sp.]|nr:hypothetical protein [Polaromonas sp.]